MVRQSYLVIAAMGFAVLSQTATANESSARQQTKQQDLVATAGVVKQETYSSKAGLLHVAKYIGRSEKLAANMFSTNVKVVIKNGGLTPLTSVQVFDDLESHFPDARHYVVSNIESPTGLFLNYGFDGRQDKALLADGNVFGLAEQGELSFDLTYYKGQSVLAKAGQNIDEGFALKLSSELGAGPRVGLTSMVMDDLSY